LEVTRLRRIGLPVLRQISVYVHAIATTPAEPLDRVALPPCYRPGQAESQRRRPSPLNRRVGFRITLFEACSAFTRVMACTLAESPMATRYTEGFNRFVTSSIAPIATGWSDPLPGGNRTRWRSAPFHGALNNPG
jgi:hypothetical protein